MKYKERNETYKSAKKIVDIYVQQYHEFEKEKGNFVKISV